MIVLLAFAFVAGVVTILSPCILPVLPVVLSSALDGRRLHSLGVVSGLVASFAFFTLTLTWLVSQLGISADALRLGGAVVVGLFGVTLVSPPLLRRLEGLISRLPSLAGARRAGGGYWGGALVGASLGVVWAPCAGPILAAVTALVATSRLSPRAVAMTISYSLGVGLPLLSIAYGGRRVLSRTRSLRQHVASLQRAFGVVMVAFALTFLVGVDRTVEAALAQAVPPEWTNALTALEDQPPVRAGLASLGRGAKRARGFLRLPPRPRQSRPRGGSRRSPTSARPPS